MRILFYLRRSLASLRAGVGGPLQGVYLLARRIPVLGHIVLWLRVGPIIIPLLAKLHTWGYRNGDDLMTGLATHYPLEYVKVCEIEGIGPEKALELIKSGTANVELIRERMLAGGKAS